MRPHSAVLSGRSIPFFHRTLLAAGVAGALLWFGGEMTLYGAFGPGRDWSQFRAVLASAPLWRVQLGAFVAPVACLFYIVGFFGLLQPSLAVSPRLAALSLVSLIATVVFEACYHSGQSAYGFAYRLMGAAGSSPAAFDELVADTRAYLHILYWATLASAVAGFGSLALLTLLGRAGYPRVFAWCNPLLLAFAQPLAEAVPAPFGRPLAGGFTHLTYLVFFMVALLHSQTNTRSGDASR